MAGVLVLVAIYWIGFFVTAIAMIIRGMPKVLYVQQQTGTAAFAGAKLWGKTAAKSFFWPITAIMKLAARGKQ
jgi:hypothetical protein